MDVREALLAGVLPGLIAGITLLLGWVAFPMLTRRRLALPVRHDLPGAGPRWMAPLLFACGVIAAAYAWHGWTAIWPVNATYRLPQVALVAAAAGLITTSTGLGAKPWRIAAVFAPVGVFTGWAFLSAAPETLIGGGERAAWIIGFGAIVAAQTFGVERAARAMPRFWAPVAMLLIVGLSMGVAVGSAFAAGAILLSPLVAVLSAGLLIAALSRPYTYAGGGLAAACVMLTSVLIAANWYGAFIWLPMSLALAGPALLGLAPEARRLGRFGPAAAAVAIALGTAGAALVINGVPDLSLSPGSEADDPFDYYGS